MMLSALAFGFVAGTLLGGPISGGADWCRVADYGSLPQWLTLALGLVAGVLTYLGVRTAQGSLNISREVFASDAKNRESAQARLVHAELSGEQRLSGVNLYVGKASLIYSIENPRMMPNFDAGTLEIASDQIVQVLKFNVTNNSDEIITILRLARYNSQNFKSDVTTDARIRPSTLPAKSDAEWIVVSDHEVVSSGYSEAQVIFQDSAGLVWRRDGARPVESYVPKGPKWDLSDPLLPVWRPWAAQGD